MNIDHTINLFSRHEQLLFSPQSHSNKVLPCVIITGFLGSGKTTVVNHLINSQSTLRLAVLVNEVGTVDIDSQVLSAKQTNAAVGTASRALAGGCACCEVIDDLRSAVKQFCSPNSNSIDYVVLETSGAAEVEPLVGTVNSCGLQVEGVVAVVDADAAATQLQHPVALKQLASADLVVLNKCDLASLGQISDAEDLVRKICPQIKLYRCRHGQVPPEMFFDTSVDEPPGGMHAEGGGRGGQADSTSAGQVAFMSHESAPLMRREGAAGVSGGLKRIRELKSKAAASETTPSTSHNQPSPPPPAAAGGEGEGEGAAAAAAAGGGGGGGGGEKAALHGYNSPHGHGHGHHQNHSHSHSHNHARISTRSFTSSHPLQLSAFQDFVVGHLLPAPGLLRTKGVLWFKEVPRQRYVLQISGRRRVECCSHHQWQGPPSCQLVLIGQEAGVLDQLVGLMQQMHSQAPGRSMPTSAATRAAQLCALISQHPRFVVLDDGREAAQPQPSTAGSQSHTPAAGTPAAAAAAVASVGAGGDASGSGRQVSATQSTSSVGDVAACPCSDAAELIEFSVEGAPLHGVVAEEVNFSVCSAVNSSGRMMLSSRAAVLLINATSLQESVCRLAALQVAVSPETEPEALWQVLEQLSAPVLRKAFAHVRHCVCDAHGVVMAR